MSKDREGDEPIGLTERQIKSYMVTVDPGIKVTGIVVWDLRGFQTNQTLPAPVFHRCFHAPKGIGDLERVSYMAQRIPEWLLNEGYTPCYVFIEYPLSYPTRGGVAVVHRGKLVHIAMLCGKMDQACTNLGCQVHMVPATWRGGRSYFQMRLHVQKYLHYPIPNDHIADALGMGIYLWGSGQLARITTRRDSDEAERAEQD